VILPAENPLLWVGRIVKTQGMRGEVRVHLSSGESTGSFSEGKVIYVEDEEGLKKPLTVKSSRGRGRGVILCLREVKGIEAAEKLIGSSIYVKKADLDPLPPDEFYWYQLQGLRVQGEDGTDLGDLEEMLPTGSNDVFVVRKNGREILLPATNEVVLRVDLKEGIMVVRPLEGLLPEDDL
jgi:16S rRNA processing protein RimM